MIAVPAPRAHAEGYVPVEHMAHLPSWDCLACGKPWPCDPAREAMLRDMDATQLAIYVWVCLEEAAEHLPGLPYEEAMDRFMNWSRI